MDNTYQRPLFMTPAQLQVELARCEFCESKPCRDACPAHCSPADFIMAARVGNPSDLRRAAGEILHANPLGGICGLVCPDYLCMAACTRMKFDGSINIPLVQATIIKMAKDLGGILPFQNSNTKKAKVAVIGGGPAGLGAAAVLAQLGYQVSIFEMRDRLGGMINLIPSVRIDPSTIETDIKFLLSMGDITVHTGQVIIDPDSLINQGFGAVCVATGLWKPIELGIENEDLAEKMVDVLGQEIPPKYTGRVLIIGGGATAVDCAITARQNGADHVELVMLEKLSEMPLTEQDRKDLVDHDIEVTCRVRVSKILARDGKISGVELTRVELPTGESFKPLHMRDVKGAKITRHDVNSVIIAIGMRSEIPMKNKVGVFYAGDGSTGPSTVVEAVASGKNAALRIHSYISGTAEPDMPEPKKSQYLLPGFTPIPVSLETDFFGTKIISPYLISASPSTDGLEQMNSAFQAGWAGGIMKTAFDNVSIHIPSEYMFCFNPTTYGNSDNVSGHSLDRVCREVETLRKEWPDRLVLASTGGPVTGEDECDIKGWQSNTKKIEACGAMGIEYSLSCPQGGDGTEGAIVSQNAALTARIIDWIMQVGDPDIPKLFKLTAAVTSIIPILRAIRKVLDKYPGKKAGVTLANSFPTLAFRGSLNSKWDEGVVVGMSGEGVTPISYLTLAQAVPEGIEISGNGGPMNYKAAMDFLALGVKTVQFCTIVMKQGYGIIRELESGTSFMMKERGISSMKELIGIAQPHPVVDFMALSAVKKLSSPDHDLCVSCGNCARCPYLAISINEKGYPITDASRCIGCSICAQKCFTGAISMRIRTPDELSVLREN